MRIVAAFSSPEALLDAAARLKEKGFPANDALSPFPIEGIEEMLGVKRPTIRRPMALAGFSAAAAAYAIEFYSAAIAYPYNSGGRPLNSIPVFVLVPFEVGILAAGIAGFATLLVKCGLPSLHHPLFAARGIERATSDRFFLAVDATREEGAASKVRAILEEIGASSVAEVQG